MPDALPPHAFYDELAAAYHLIFVDWEAAIAWQAERLDSLIQTRWPGAHSVLDVACGIGTQAIGLARRGYSVAASDISLGAVARTRLEAYSRGLQIQLLVADFRALPNHPSALFDVVLACDNAIAHVLDDDELHAGLTQMTARLRPGGACVLSVRDYGTGSNAPPELHAYGVRDRAEVRYLPLQVWDDEGETYTMSFYLVEDRATSRPEAQVWRTRCRKRTIARVTDLLKSSGLVDIACLDAGFYQPVLVGTRPAS